MRFRPHSTGEVSTLSSFTGDRSESLSRMGVVLAECSMGMLVIGEVGSVVVIGEVGIVVVIGGLAITGVGGMEGVTGTLSIGGVLAAGWFVTTGGLLRRWAL